MTTNWHSNVAVTPLTTNQYTELLKGEKFSVEARTMVKGQVIKKEKHSNMVQLVFLTVGCLRVTIYNGPSSPMDVVEFHPGAIFAVPRNTYHLIECTRSAVFTSVYLEVL